MTLPIPALGNDLHLADVPADPTLKRIAVVPPSIVGGKSGLGIVELTAPAPNGGVSVLTWSENAAILAAPSSVYIPVGESVGTFTVTTKAVEESIQVKIFSQVGPMGLAVGVHVTPKMAATTSCPPPASYCTPPAIVSADHAYGEVGRPFAWYIQTVGGPGLVSVTGLPSWATFDPTQNKISGTPDRESAAVVGVQFAAGDCGTATQTLQISIVGSLMVWGNWKSPPPAEFKEEDFLDAGEHWAPNAGGYMVGETDYLPDIYEFSVPPTGSDWYQVMWIPDSLLGTPPDPLIKITASHFPVNLQPTKDTPYQSLVVAGTPGKVFLTAAPNNGGFTVAGGNPWVIQIVATTVIWGNWKEGMPPGYAFTESDFLSDEKWDATTGSYNISSRVGRAGMYEIAVPTPGSNYYQVMWMPDSLLSATPPPLQIKVQGFDFNLQPANNTPYQSLSITGVPGKVFVSAAPNNGGFNASSGNPWIIS